MALRVASQGAELQNSARSFLQFLEAARIPPASAALGWRSGWPDIPAVSMAALRRLQRGLSRGEAAHGWLRFAHTLHRLNRST